MGLTGPCLVFISAAKVRFKFQATDFDYCIIKNTSSLQMFCWVQNCSACVKGTESFLLGQVELGRVTKEYAVGLLLLLFYF